jgi:hypothetical protein
VTPADTQSCLPPAQAAEQLSSDAEALLVFLRAKGYPIGPDHYIRLQLLLAFLAERGELPPDAAALRQWVSPIICQSALDQERLRTDLDEWTAARSHRKPDAPTADLVRDLGNARLRWVITLFVVMVAAFAAAGLKLFLDATPGPASGVSTSAPMSLQIALVVLILVSGAYFLWSRARLRGYLLQRRTSEPASGSGLWVKRMDIAIFDRPTLSLAARGFGTWWRIPSNDLDIQASVRRTAEEAGRFVPVLTDRPNTPEYLVLIDRCGWSDFQARLATGIVKGLEEQAIAIDTYYFDGSPEQCFAERDFQPVSMQVIAERHPEHRLLVFSTGGGFLSEFTNQYGSWMRAFGAWQTKTLFTPALRDHWGFREHVLIEAGWIVIPATREEIANHAIEAGPPTKSTGAFMPGVSGWIFRHEHLALAPQRPPDSDVRDLLAELRLSLGGNAFCWLSACAAYPVPDWNVALFLGSNLRSESGEALFSGPALLAVASLPWFRRGRMPKWLRLELLRTLSASYVADVRALLRRMIVHGADSPIDSYRLPVEVGSGAFCLTRQILDRIRQARRGGPLEDQVFFSFVAGTSPTLALPLPPRIYDALRRRPIPSESGWLRLTQVTQNVWLRFNSSTRKGYQETPLQSGPAQIFESKPIKSLIWLTLATGAASVLLSRYSLETFQKFIHSPPGQLAAGGMLAGIVWKFFERVEAVLSEDVRLEIAVWLLDRKKLSPTFQNWPEMFAMTFERVFGRKHLSWTCIWRSTLGSLLVGLVIFPITGDSSLPEYYATYLKKEGQLLGIAIFYTFIAVIPGYVCLFETRFILSIMKRSRAAFWFLLMLCDLIIKSTTVVVLSVMLTSFVYGTPGSVAIRELYFQKGSISGVGISVAVSAAVTSIWLWLYAGSGFLLKAARRFDIGFEWFNRNFDLEKKPLQSIGLVAGGVVALTYWSVVILQKVL